MAYTGTAYADLSQRTQAFAHANALNHAQPVLTLEKFAQIKPMPANKALAVKFRRPVPFGPALTPLTEGVTPSGGKMAYEDVPGTLAQYGDVHEFSDVVADTAEDPVLKDLTKLVGEQAGETKELLTWGVLIGGTAVFYDTKAHAARNTVDSKFTVGRQQAVVRFLKNQRAKKVAEILSGSTKIGSSSVQAAYVGFIHTDLEYDIREAPGFIDVADYGVRTVLCPEEIGTIGEVRYIANPILTNWPDAGGTAATNGLISTTGPQADVYPIVIVGKEAFGCVPLVGKEAIDLSIINPNKKDKSDILGQRGYVGFKMWFLALILNQLWMARIEVGATEL